MLKTRLVRLSAYRPLGSTLLAGWLGLAAAVGIGFAQEAKSPPEAVALFGDAAKYQNEKLFQLAVEDWTKFLAKYPNDPLTPVSYTHLTLPTNREV